MCVVWWWKVLESIAAVEKWYNGIEDERDLAEEAVKALTGLRFKVWGMAPNCDPDTWRELAGDYESDE